LNVQEYEAAAAKLGRRLREPGLVELLSESGWKENGLRGQKGARKTPEGSRQDQAQARGQKSFLTKNTASTKIQFGPPHSQKINWAVASAAEYKRLRALAKQIEEFNHPPFTVQRNGTKVNKEKATDVLNYVVEDGQEGFTITRFKGLGEMNAEQLWDTTMNGTRARCSR